MHCYVPSVQPSEQFVSLRGYRHRTLHWGPQSQPPIFLLHGFQDCVDTFQMLIDALPRSWRFIGLDWRGFGGSDWQNSPYWFPDYLADLDALLELMAPDATVTLLGHSMGGNVANLYAGIRPARVARLISLEGFGLPRTPPEQAPERYAKWLEQLRAGPQPSRYDSVDLLAMHLRQRNVRLPEENAAFIAKAWMQRTENGLPRMHFDPFHRYVNPVLHRREEAEACWHRVEADTLLVLATESEYRRRLDHEGDVERMHRCFKHLSVEDMPGLGHMMHHEDPARVAEVIFRWWSLRSGQQ